MDIRTLIVAGLLILGSGCTSTKFGKDSPGKVPDGVPSSPLSTMARPEVSPIVQASASTPSAGSSLSTSMSKLTGSSKPAKPVPVIEMTALWRNKVDYLPDPSKNGAMGAGLAGQLFLFGPGMQFALAEGKLTVALYDETPRPGQETPVPEGWEFDKETLKKLVTMDERFGKSYALFLPWPTYRPDVTKVRIAIRYDPEQGHPLYAAETRITLDNSVAGGSSAEWSNPGRLGAQPNSPLGGPPPLDGSSGPGLGMIPSGPVSGSTPNGSPAPFGSVPPAPPNFGAMPQVPAYFGAVPQVPANFSGAGGGQGIPPGLPPMVMMVPHPGGQ
jgi:hypothetical protein